MQKLANSCDCIYIYIYLSKLNPKIKIQYIIRITKNLCNYILVFYPKYII